MVRRIKTHHTADVIKGNRAPNDLDKQLEFDPVELSLITGGVIFEGRIVHINDQNRWALGVGDQHLPWVLMNNSDDLDVVNDGGDPTTEADAWKASTPSGEAKAVCVIGSEFEVTEFDTSRTYLNNDPLTAPPSTGVGSTMLSTSGVLTNSNVAYGSDCIVGIVTEARTPTSPKNSNQRPSLKFMGYFLPKLP